jgi:type II secretory pathway pseudopilin PulG
MKAIIKNSKQKLVPSAAERTAFTIIELLTVMSIIVILIGLLVPALNMVKKYAWEVRQKAQFNSIDIAIELFNTEFSSYPDSSERGPDGQLYCGAMKLCEAMMGQDLMGFHPDSIFRSDGTDGTKILYPDANAVTPEAYRDNLSIRKGPYLPLESANAYRLTDIHPNVSGFVTARHFVLCDVYRTVTHRVTGKKIGMPILYYRANTANNLHDIANPNNSNNIYNYKDNQWLIALGIPSDPPPNGSNHRLYDPVRFYKNTKNDKVTTAFRPYRADSFILISAGFDGEYGTPDDICNFDWKYQE